nr:hypothetical protein HmN_000554600 [Hymenolepis microstoma]
MVIDFKIIRREYHDSCVCVVFRYRIVTHLSFDEQRAQTQSTLTAYIKSLLTTIGVVVCSLPIHNSQFTIHPLPPHHFSRFFPSFVLSKSFGFERSR